ncbi:Stress-response A/B barrel domain-containing protein [Drosera capensis]
MRVQLVKLKEGVGEREREEVMEVFGGVEGKVEGLSGLSYGVNFTPGRAKGFGIGCIGFFDGVRELGEEGVRSEVVEKEKERVRGYIDGVIVADYVLPEKKDPSSSLVLIMFCDAFCDEIEIMNKIMQCILLFACPSSFSSGFACPSDHSAICDLLALFDEPCSKDVDANPTYSICRRYSLPSIGGICCGLVLQTQSYVNLLFLSAGQAHAHIDDVWRLTRLRGVPIAMCSCSHAANTFTVTPNYFKTMTNKGKGLQLSIGSTACCLCDAFQSLRSITVYRMLVYCQVVKDSWAPNCAWVLVSAILGRAGIAHGLSCLWFDIGYTIIHLLRLLRDPFLEIIVPPLFPLSGVPPLALAARFTPLGHLPPRSFTDRHPPSIVNSFHLYIPCQDVLYNTKGEDKR